MNKLFTDLNNYAKENPNIIEIAFSLRRTPLYAKQKRSKYLFQFPPAWLVFPFIEYSFPAPVIFVV